MPKAVKLNLKLPDAQMEASPVILLLNLIKNRNINPLQAHP
jgi:hypothetical protein